MQVRTEGVEVVSLSGPMGTMKLMKLRVTECDDASRLGTELTMQVPREFDVEPGFVGIALWMPGEELPKLVLHPSGK